MSTQQFVPVVVPEALFSGIQDENKSVQNRLSVLVVCQAPIIAYALKCAVFDQELKLGQGVFDTLEDPAKLLGKMVSSGPYQVLVLDLDAPLAMEALKMLNLGERLKAVAIVSDTDEGGEKAVAAMRAGFKAVIRKSAQVNEYEAAISAVLRGEVYLDSITLALVMKAFVQVCATSATDKKQERPELSSREREIVQLIGQGNRNKEMAEKLNISEQTVKNHLHNIFGKLGVSDRLELALYALHKGLVTGVSATGK